MRLVATLAAATLAFSAGECLAVSKAVKQACGADYAAYCSQHKVGTPGLKECMRAHRKMLTNDCIQALGNSDEVTQRDIDDYKRDVGRN